MRTRNLVEFGPQVVSRHPLVRSVVYHSTRSRNKRGFIGRWWLRATRLHAAAEAELTAGSLDRGGALLDRAQAGPTTLGRWRSLPA